MRVCQEEHRPRGLPIVMKHGNFDGVFPPPRPRAEVLKDLGLRDDLPVLGCTGSIRHYKGLDLACEAVALSRGAWQLIIAGPPHPDFDLDGLRRRVSSIPGAVLIARKLSDSEFSDVASACDVILLPYRKITTCSMIIGAFTLGRGVVASDLPYFREILGDHPEAGILVKPSDPQALFLGIRSYLTIPQSIRNEAAKRLGDTFAWDQVIRPVAEAFGEKIGRLRPVNADRVSV
jgi:glycosyltransferase involved in cell wall biosynthesis